MVSKSGEFEPAILFVEDDPLTRVQLGELLRRCARSLHLAENGEQGLKMYNDIRPDVVITDILMPVMNGLDMARQIRKINPLAQIIVITAYSDVDHLTHSNEMLLQYIWKPVDIEELFRVIDKCREKILDEKKGGTAECTHSDYKL